MFLWTIFNDTFALASCTQSNHLQLHASNCRVCQQGLDDRGCNYLPFASIVTCFLFNIPNVETFHCFCVSRRRRFIFSFAFSKTHAYMYFSTNEEIKFFFKYFGQQKCFFSLNFSSPNEIVAFKPFSPSWRS